MATFYTILTDVGQAKLANAIALGETLEITHLAVGDGNGNLPEPDTDRTALVNEVRRAQINRSEVDAENPSWVVLEQVLPPDVGGWTIREIGVFDTEGDLIGYGNYPETYKPVLSEGSSRTQTVRFVLEVSDTAAVTLKVDPSVVLATREYADDAVEEHAAKTAEVHGIPAGKSAIHTGLKATKNESEQGAENKYPDAADVHSAILANPYKAKAIGEPFALWDHLDGVNPPSNSGTAKYIKLTAGEDGVGQYNEGLLTNESVFGSAPIVEATAEIAVGPMAGQIVHLLNSENRYLMPGENSGDVADDQMQQIVGEFQIRRSTDASSEPVSNSIGAIQTTNNSGVDSTRLADATGTGFKQIVRFDSSTSNDARTGDHTNVKHSQASYYMRIA